MLCNNCQAITLSTKKTQERGRCSYCTPHPSGRVKMLKLVPKERPAMDQFVAVALKKLPAEAYLPDEVEVDVVAGGAYVQAWIWVDDKEIP